MRRAVRLYTKRSMIGHIFSFRVLTERRREFWQGLLAAYVNLCEAFDSVNWDALWMILSLHGVPPKRINVISEPYSSTENAVRCGGSKFQSYSPDVRLGL